MEGLVSSDVDEKFLTWNSVNRYQRLPGEAPHWTPNREKAAVFKDEQEPESRSRRPTVTEQLSSRHEQAGG